MQLTVLMAKPNQGRLCIIVLLYYYYIHSEIRYFLRV